jgi:putative membrane protein insertion efficiency factor
MIRRVLAAVSNFLSLILICMVRFYQIALSPLLPQVCRYDPSCSQYFILAVRKFGPIYGSWKGVCRVCRCHPWHPGGYDPP